MLCTVRTSWQHSLLWLCLICSTRHTGNPPMWSPSFSDRYVQSHLLNTGTKLKIVFHFAVRQRHLRYSQGVCYSHCLFYFFVLLCIFEIKKFITFSLPYYCSPHAREIKLVLRDKTAGLAFYHRKILDTLFSQPQSVLYQKSHFLSARCS